MQNTNVEQDNLTAVRRGFEAFAKQDMATLTELFEPNAVWRAAPGGILSGNYNGRDQIFAFFAQIGGETQGTFASKPTAFAATGDQVWVRATTTGQRKGKSLNSEEMLVFTLANGKVHNVQLFVYDHEASAEFWK